MMDSSCLECVVALHNTILHHIMNHFMLHYVYCNIAAGHVYICYECLFLDNPVKIYSNTKVLCMTVTIELHIRQQEIKNERFKQ